ncbi:MAG: YvcK family protein [Desulfobacula sp.]|nr:YvcK family protein [Desulfobacula sp.]
MGTQEKKIVTIGGGSGQFVLLSGLRDLEDTQATAIVSMMDSGGSIGRLRDELGILPPGDILKYILALSPYQDACRSILLKRFKKDRRLADHTAGNMLLTMLSRYTGNFPAGVAALAEILNVDGTILPVTIDRATLVAELTSGKRIYGEEAICPGEPSGNKSKRSFWFPTITTQFPYIHPCWMPLKRQTTFLSDRGICLPALYPTLLFLE